jgi:hypothetical protein
VTLPDVADTWAASLAMLDARGDDARLREALRRRLYGRRARVEHRVRYYVRRARARLRVQAK